jgi:hypothetical protein
MQIAKCKLPIEETSYRIKWLARRLNCANNRMGNLQLSICNLQFAILIALFPFIILFLSGASASSNAEDLLYAGNVAFAREDYETALALYRQAEGRVSDPGLLSFNEGAALYRLGRYRDAEIHYWLSRQDAAGARLARVLYDLGNAVFQQAEKRDAPLLQRAIGFYEECLRQAEADAELLESARHNLAFAQALLKQAKARKDNRPDESNPGRNPQGDSKPDAQPSLAGAQSGMEENAGPGSHEAEGSGNANQADAKNPRYQGGIGNLPPVPDRDQLVPLTAHDASAYLEKAAERILKERRTFYGKSVHRPSQNIKDW